KTVVQFLNSYRDGCWNWCYVNRYRNLTGIQRTNVIYRTDSQYRILYEFDRICFAKSLTALNHVHLQDSGCRGTYFVKANGCRCAVNTIDNTSEIGGVGAASDTPRNMVGNYTA